MSSPVSAQRYLLTQEDQPPSKKPEVFQITLNVGGRDFSFNKSTFEQDYLKQTVFEIYAQSKWTPEQEPPKFTVKAEIFEKFMVPYINDHIIPNFAEITSQEDFNSLNSDVKAFGLTALDQELKNQDIKFLAKANWSENLPMPQTLVEEDKKKWSSLPLETKIKAILQVIRNKENYNKDELKVLRECWAKSLECSSGKKILEIRRFCLHRMPKELQEKENAQIVFQFSQGEISLPRFYQEALARDSTFFNGYFPQTELIENRYHLKEVNKDDFEKLLNIWSEDYWVASIQEVFDLLQISDLLDLEKKSLEGVIVEAIRTWSANDEDAISNTFDLLKYPSGFFDTAHKLKDELVNFLIKIYLNAHRKKNIELVQSCLSSLSELEIKTLDLNNGRQIDEKELKNLIKCSPKLNSLLLKAVKISEKSAERIAQLNHLTSLDVSWGVYLTDQAMEQIAKLTNLKSLDVNSCIYLTDQAMESIAKLTHLVSLDVSRCRALTDQAMGSIAKLTHLTSLNVRGCSALTDQAMEQIAKLTHLTSLNVYECNRLTDLAMVPIANLMSLTSLNVGGCSQLTDGVMEQIAKLTHLTTLDLMNCGRLKGQTMEHIAKLTHLTSLDVSSCRALTDQAMGSIAKLTNLTSLDVCFFEALTDLALEPVTKLTYLTSLNVNWCDQLTNQAMGSIVKLTNLTSLNLMGCYKLTDQAMESIANLTDLTILNINNCRELTDQAIEPIAKLTHLTSFELSECKKLTDQAMKPIAKLINLTLLNLSHCDSLTDRAMEPIAKLISLTSLDVSQCIALTDQAVGSIAKLTNLTSLYVSCCYKLTDQAMESIAKLTYLTSLDVSRCFQLTDQAMVPIANLTHLISIDVSQCKNLMTDQAKKLIAKIREKDKFCIV